MKKQLSNLKSLLQCPQAFGTYLIDWNGNKKTDYKVIQPEPVNADAVSSGSYIKLEFDKNTASVGEIIRATVKVNNVKNLAGYQICIKYDPNVLQPVNPNTGSGIYNNNSPCRR